MLTPLLKAGARSWLQIAVHQLLWQFAD